MSSMQSPQVVNTERFVPRAGVQAFPSEDESAARRLQAVGSRQPAASPAGRKKVAIALRVMRRRGFTLGKSKIMAVASDHHRASNTVVELFHHCAGFGAETVKTTRTCCRRHNFLDVGELTTMPESAPRITDFATDSRDSAVETSPEHSARGIRTRLQSFRRLCVHHTCRISVRAVFQ